MRAGRTIDQVAADTLGRGTQLRSLELSVEDFTNAVGTCDIGYACSYVNTLSWRTASTPLPMQTNPRVVFERLFGDERDPERRRRQLQEDRSILDAIADQTTELRRQIGSADNARVTEYLDSVREVEQRVAAMHDQPLDLALPEIPSGVPDSYDEHVKLMLDLQVLAYQADITRVSTMMLGREASTRTYGHIGVPDPHHAISHHGYVPELMERVEQINRYHVSLLGYYLAQARGDARRRTAPCWISRSSSTAAASATVTSTGHVGLPALLAGGAAGQLEGGRHLRYEDDTPHANLLMSMLEKVGVEVDGVGDATGSLDRL